MAEPGSPAHGAAPPTFSSPSAAAAQAPGSPDDGADLKGPAPAFPLARVRKIMKEDKDVQKMSSDGVAAVAFSTELFLSFLLEKAYEYAQRDKRKTVMYKDIARAVQEVEQLDFLKDVIPNTVALKDAVKMAKNIQAL